MSIVITYNLEYGAAAYGTRKAASIISRTGADVALLQEVKTETGVDVTDEIASHLGWYAITFSQSQTAIISELPIEKLSEGKHFGLGRIGRVYYCVIHLSDYPYLPFEAAGIKYPPDCAVTPEQPCFTSKSPIVLENRSRKQRELQFAEIARALRRLPVEAPIIAGGDFNEPSHLDWTSTEVRRQKVPVAVMFPGTGLMESLGFQDAYRSVHPSIITHPGYTWPDRAVNYEHRSDRIDFIFTRNLSTTESTVIRTAVSDHSIVLAEIERKA